MTDEGHTCVICSDSIALVSDDVASCGSCSQLFHLDCLRSALSVDSRCPLCRSEVATVGYRDRNSIVHPESRRLFGNLEERLANYERQLEQMTWARQFLDDMGDISNSMVQLLRRVQRMMVTARRRKAVNVWRDAKALLAAIGDIDEKASALRTRYEDRTGWPEDFNHSADSIFQRVGPLLESLTSTVQRYSEVAKARVDAVESGECSTSKSSGQSASSQASRAPRKVAKKTCRRSSLALLAVRRRPAAAENKRKVEDAAQRSKPMARTLTRKKPKENRKVLAVRKMLQKKQKSVGSTRKVRKGHVRKGQHS